jgi:hypothetical protein
MVCAVGEFLGAERGFLLTSIDNARVLTVFQIPAAELEFVVPFLLSQHTGDRLEQFPK